MDGWKGRRLYHTQHHESQARQYRDNRSVSFPDKLLLGHMHLPSNVFLIIIPNTPLSSDRQIELISFLFEPRRHNNGSLCRHHLIFFLVHNDQRLPGNFGRHQEGQS